MVRKFIDMGFSISKFEKAVLMFYLYASFCIVLMLQKFTCMHTPSPTHWCLDTVYPLFLRMLQHTTLPLVLLTNKITNHLFPCQYYKNVKIIHFHRWLKLLNEYGVCLITGVPCSTEAGLKVSHYESKV